MSKEAKKTLNGKEFVASLEECRSSKDIFALLDKTMEVDVLKERLANIRDNDLVIALNAQVAKFNAGQGLRTSHQDCVNMAADRFQQVTKKGVKFFKAEANKYITGCEMAKETPNKQKTSPALLNAQMAEAMQAVR